MKQTIFNLFKTMNSIYVGLNAKKLRAKHLRRGKLPKDCSSRTVLSSHSQFNEGVNTATHVQSSDTVAFKGRPQINLYCCFVLVFQFNPVLKPRFTTRLKRASLSTSTQPPIKWCTSKNILFGKLYTSLNSKQKQQMYEFIQQNILGFYFLLLVMCTFACCSSF